MPVSRQDAGRERRAHAAGRTRRPRHRPRAGRACGCGACWTRPLPSSTAEAEHRHVWTSAERDSLSGYRIGKEGYDPLFSGDLTGSKDPRDRLRDRRTTTGTGSSHLRGMTTDQTDGSARHRRHCSSPATLVAGAVCRPRRASAADSAGRGRTARRAASPIAAARAAKAGHRLAGLPRRLGPGEAHPVRLGHRAARLRQAERQADQARRRPHRQHRDQGGAPGRARLQPRRPRRLRPALPAPGHDQGPAVGQHVQGVRLRGLRPARRRPLRAHLLRRPAGVRQGAQGRPGPGHRGRQARPAQARRASTRTAARSAAARCCRT